MQKLNNYLCSEIGDFETTDEYRIKLKERKNIKEGEKISIVSDTMFKAMFMSEKKN